MSTSLPVTAEEGLPRPGGAWRLRPVNDHDLPRLSLWLPPTADRRLPAPHGAERWWLLETPEGPRACVRLRPVIGRDRLRHWYHVGCVVHAAPSLNLFHQQNTLLLGNDHTGAAELADLAWDPDLDLPEQSATLQQLLRAALLLLARDRAQLGAQLIVELPGLRDEAGRSPFWEGLGRHFYAGEPQEALHRFGPAWRSHVAALLPRQPVYVSFLPAAAQSAIAQAPLACHPLLGVLAAEGLRYGHHITIDEGGPVFEARLDTLPAVLQVRRRNLVEARPRGEWASTTWLVAGEDGDEVLALRARGTSPQTLAVPADWAAAGLTGPRWTLPLAV